MKTTVGIVMLLVLIGSAQIIYDTYDSKRVYPFSVTIGTNMLMVVIFGPLLCDLKIGVSNYSNACYATVVCAQCVILETRGRAAFVATMPMVYSLMISVFALISTLALAQPVPGNEDFAVAVYQIGSYSPLFMAASFSAFAISMHLGLLTTWTKMRPRFGPLVAVLLASIACQALDTPVFFVIAFWELLSTEKMFEAMATAFLFKSALAVIMLPVFIFATRQPSAVTA